MPPSRAPRAPSGLVGARRASSASRGKPGVLAKPERFNPPSHGSRLKRGGVPKHYAPPLTRAEAEAQKLRHYPGLMPPEGTFAHRVWTSRLLHVFITMGILFTMAVATFFLNYTHNSPFKDLVPPISDLWDAPAYFFTAWKNVIVMHEQDKAIRAYHHRMRGLDDVVKNKYYMKMHGIEPKDPVLMVFGKGGEADPDREPDAPADAPPHAEHRREEPAPRKKWFGIF